MAQTLDDKTAKRILDMLARKANFKCASFFTFNSTIVHVLAVDINSNSPQTLVFEKNHTYQQVILPIESSFKEMLEYVLSWVKRGWDVVVPYHDVPNGCNDVILPANTTLEELLIQLDLEV